MNNIVLNVHQLNEYVKSLLARDTLLRDIRVKGEISNFKHHYSGHMYFTLKDDSDSIRCVFFKQNNQDLEFEPKDGMNVIVGGTTSIFGRDGQYQLYVDDMEQDGLGNLHLAFERLKKKLAQEGLFEQKYKKPLPKYPRKIAIVTSHTGAAVRDIIRVTRRRNKTIDILVVPVAVQGPDAYKQISRAIDYVNTRDDIDIIIVGRGGGSLEDLWAFNEEDVARSIWNSAIPIISAVGHETDFTISDFVADVRAITPSAAAEIAVPETQQLLRMTKDIRKSLFNAINNCLTSKKYQLDIIKNNYVFKTPCMTLDQQSQYIDQLSQRLDSSAKNIIKNNRQMLSKLVANLNNLNPLNVLSRGYTITLKTDSDNIISSVGTLKPGDNLKIYFRDGQVKCKIIKTAITKGLNSNEKTLI